MKKTTIAWLVAAACLILIGGAVFCFVMTLNRWNFSLLEKEKMETRTFDINEDFENIAVRLDTEKLEFCRSDDGKCRVICVEKEKEGHSVSVRNGTLAIEKEDSRKWYDRISLFSFAAPTVTVYLPQAEYAALSVETSTGEITVPADFRFDRAEIDLSTGDVDFCASVSGRLHIKTSTGDIRTEGITAGELDLQVVTGRVDVRSAVCEGAVGIDVSTGKANLTDVSCKSLRSDGSTGSIVMENVIAAESISIERSTGDVRFERCDAGELTVRTSTGKVSGSLLSDKVFIAHSDTGHVDVPETTSGGTCRITTTTGSIRITAANG